jgi:hypothetical protein
MIELGVLMLLGVAVVAACALAVLLKALLWVLLLPFRILFWTLAGLVSLPLLLLNGLVGGLVLLLALPLFLVSLLVGGLAVGFFALLLPLLPILLVVGLVWYLLEAPPHVALRGE